MEHEGRIERLNDAGQWPTWKFHVKITLVAAGVYEIVTGDDMCPVEDNAKIRTWRKSDAKAQQIIGVSVGSSQIVHIANCASSKEMWDKLHAVFEHKNETSLLLLHQQFFNFCKDSGENMVSFISRLEVLVRRLRDLKETISDDMVITKIIMALPPEYANFCSAWESTSKTERNLDNLRARLMMEEERLTARGIVSSTEALAAKSKTHKFGKKRYEGKTKNPRTVGRCFGCGDEGHWKRDCPRKNKGKNNSQAFNSDNSDFAVNADSWLLDSGASHHMTSNREWFATYREEKRNVKIAKGSIAASGIGSINIKYYDGENWNDGYLKDVLYVPQIETNLFSQNRALDQGLLVEADSQLVKFKNISNKKTILIGKRNGNLTVVLIKALQAKANVAKNIPLLKDWHEKLAHQNVEYVRKYLRSNDIPFIDENFECEACMYGKQHRESFTSRKVVSKHCGDIVHADLCGPIEVPSIGGSRYFLLLKDDYSHFRFVYFLKQKTEVYEKVKAFLQLSKNAYGYNIKVFRSDNGTEFVNNRMKALFESEGIRHQRTVPYTPEQNGSAEREMRTIMEAARTMLYSKNMELKFWAEAVNAAAFVINRTGTSTIEGKSPYELWCEQKPHIKEFQPFGCDVFAHIPKEKRHKLDPKSTKCIFVGYDENVKGFRLWNPRTRNVEIYRDVNFIIPSIENRIGNRSEEKRQKEVSSFKISPIDKDDDIVVSTIDERNVMENVSSEEHVNENVSFDGNNAIENIYTDDDSSEREVKGKTKWFSNIDAENILENRLRDRNKGNKDNVDKGPNLNFSALMSTIYDEPTSFQEAMKSSNKNDWVLAMEEELESLARNKTWIMVYPPDGQKLVDNKWVYKVKYNLDGSLKQFKARLVAKGFTQKYGVDYEEVFSPVVKFSSIRAILSIVATRKMTIRQFDVKTAFLYGDLEEQVYMRQPEGFDDKSGKVCKLMKSLYGLKQSSRCWNKKFTKFIKENQLIQSVADPCVFTSEDKTLILALYVDDGLIAATSEDKIRDVISQLSKYFEMKFFRAECFLGLEIERYDDGSISLHQTNYSRKIISRFNMDDCKTVTTPLDVNQVAEVFADSRDTKFPYRESVGSLIYLAIATRPDISFAVGVVSRFLDNPTSAHVNNVKRIFKYLKSTINYGIYVTSNNPIKLLGYSDADYAADKETRRSTSGFVFFYNGNIISWGSERQRSVALSTTESEYIAACVAVKELIWFQRLIEELTGSKIETEFNMDNQSAIRLIKNPEFHKRTKHIDVRYHFIREKFEARMFSLRYVTSDEQLADIFTKPLPKCRFELLRNLLCIKQK